MQFEVLVRTCQLGARNKTQKYGSDRNKLENSDCGCLLTGVDVCGHQRTTRPVVFSKPNASIPLSWLSVPHDRAPHLQECKPDQGISSNFVAMHHSAKPTACFLGKLAKLFVDLTPLAKELRTVYFRGSDALHQENTNFQTRKDGECCTVNQQCV